MCVCVCVCGCVQKVSRLRLYLPQQKRTIN